MLFAHLKRIVRLDRLRLRGPNGARDKFILVATAQNLQKFATLVPAAPPIPDREGTTPYQLRLPLPHALPE